MSKLKKEDFVGLFAKWSELRDEIQAHYKKRNNGSNDLMEKGIDLLNELIDLADGTCPLNYQERFTFIKQNYKTFAAFRQLDELFKETEKKLALRFIMESRKP
ncbi:YpoC family protein [Psychrobacillus sp. BL-248-WT-3]|uniref:YpoC family protein n=1 Tax=Psychrobacillus sp. BL-248-WT-3 TaxID=2725306 RepID=UPI00146BD8A8|nr:hypothetical protein [Psychrobacillus sp. BL-248-WT-3]NME05816.1 hypothetical protein [Psychrobacillus sp. BL-248-WT-3]